MQRLNSTRFEVSDIQGQPMLVSVATELMDYVEPARTFGSEDLADPAAAGRHQPRVIAVPDRRDGGVGPMLLSLGNQRRLALVRRSGQQSAGWDHIDLSAGLERWAQGPVVAFGAAWTAQDRIAVAVAVQEPGATPRCRILIAYDLSSRSTDWSALPWTDHGALDKLSIDAIRILPPAGDVWTTVLSGGEGSKRTVYLLRSDRPQSFSLNRRVFSTATDLQSISDFQAGAWSRNGALYVVGRSGRDEPVLFMRALPAFNADGEADCVTPVSVFDAPAAARVLALGRDQGAGVGGDLYIGGQGVHCIAAPDLDDQEDAPRQTLVEPVSGNDVCRLVVAENHAGAATVWALREQGQLFTLLRPGADAAWGTPLQVREGVVEVAPVEGDDHVTSSVIVVYKDRKAAHLWRDAAGIWQETPIAVADPQGCATTTSFATNVRVLDHSGLPRAGVAVTIRASVPSFLVVSGRSHAVGPHCAVTVKTDFNGAVSIFDRALSFSPATYRLSVAGLEHALDINPAHSLYTRLASLTADELRGAQVGHGDFLLGEDYRSGAQRTTVDAFVQAMRQAAELGLCRSGDTGGVRLVAAAAPFAVALSAGSLPDGYHWGMSSDGAGGLQPLRGPQAVALAARPECEGGLFTRLGDSISDLFEGLCNGIRQAVSFVVRKAGEVVEFVCAIGDRVKRFVLSSLEEIGAFFTWAWNGLKAAASKAWDYLKFLFDWDDILAVRRKMADIVEHDLEQLRDQVRDLKGRVGAGFDRAIAAIRHQGQQLGVRPARDIKLIQGSGELAREQGQHGGVKDAVLDSGPGAWIIDQLGKIAGNIVQIELPADEGSVDVFDALLRDQSAVLKSLSAELGQDFKEIFGDQGFKLAELDPDKIQKIILTLGIRIAEAAASSLKSVVLRLIDLLAGFIELVRKVLFSTVRLPFVEKLVRFVSGRELDTSVRLIDAVLLAPAVLSTITYKLVFKDAPLQEVLQAPLPVPTRVSAQSGDTWQKLMFIKEIGGTYASFVAIALDAFPAAAPVPVQQATTKLQWLGWTAGFIGHVAGNNPLWHRHAPQTTYECYELSFVIGLIQYSARFAKLKYSPSMPPPAYASYAYALAGFEVVCYALQLILKTAGYLANDDRRDGWEFVQFCGRTASQAVMQGSRLMEEPSTKQAMITGALLADLFLNLGVGITRHAMAYTRAAQAQPRPAVRRLVLPKALPA